MTARKATDLAKRLAELGISAAELSAIVSRPLEQITAWLENGPDAEARVLLRVLDNPHVATLAADRIKSLRTHDLRGEGAEQAGIDVPPYGGGHAGVTGQVPS